MMGERSLLNYRRNLRTDPELGGKVKEFGNEKMGVCEESRAVSQLSRRGRHGGDFTKLCKTFVYPERKKRNVTGILERWP